MKIVVEDADILQQLCGAGDSHLGSIEKLIGVRLNYRGNTFEVPDTLDEPRKELVRSLFSQMVRFISEGFELDEYQINLIYHDLLPDGFYENGGEARQFALVAGKKILAKSRHQRDYLKAMDENQVVFGIGPAGTGKTFLAIAKALESLHAGEVKKIVLTRPVVEAGESLGFLPGDLTQKISPYLKPLYDAMENMISLHTVKKMEEQGVIEIAPLAYMRGRSLQQAFIILDEAQNSTKEQMKMFLTRIGFGAKAVVTGDITQIDLPKKHNSGLLHASRLLHAIPGIESIMMDTSDVVRSLLVRRIIHAYEKESEKQER